MTNPVNRMREAALEILRENASCIKVSKRDIQAFSNEEIVIRPSAALRGLPENSPQVSEVKDALKYVIAHCDQGQSPYGHPAVGYVQGPSNVEGHETIASFTCPDGQYFPILQSVATFLADNDVNFPGSEAHRSKTV